MRNQIVCDENRTSLKGGTYYAEHPCKQSGRGRRGN